MRVRKYVCLYYFVSCNLLLYIPLPELCVEEGEHVGNENGTSEFHGNVFESLWVVSIPI